MLQAVAFFSLFPRSASLPREPRKTKLFSPAAIGRRVRLCVAPPRRSRARRLRPAGVRLRPPLAPAWALFSLVLSCCGFPSDEGVRKAKTLFCLHLNIRGGTPN
ncbi:uncharacterized protein EV154DRAFT_482861 [Mucor mucedo]|uniref:uncharacterized protein n=1 Tax=Mucor mucedo TaxID=29922 RepID=UPI00221F79E9|nr:uncharacterized protein EV154DRAFT_482861 [Mucor mucedo]KAI7889746.1 hypothetical protein EV154DRAFT_482861 [Mucor mucedo]